MSKYDLFYSSNDIVATENIQFSHSANAGFTASHGSFDFPIASGSYDNLRGKYASISEGGLSTVYCKIINTTATTLTVQPMESQAGTREAATQTFTASASISDAAEPACVLSLDLTNAPEDDYKYLIIACGNLSADSSTDEAMALLTSNNRPADHLSGDNGSFTKNRNLCRITFQDGLHTFDSGDQLEYETYNWCVSHLASPRAGELQEYNVQALSQSGTCYMKNARVAAIRVPSDSLEDDEGKTASVGTEAAGTYTDGVSVTATVGADHLIVCTGCIQSSSVSDPVSLKLLDGATTLSEVTIQPNSTTDCIPFGFMLGQSLSISDVVKLQFKGNGSNTATLKYANLVAIPLTDDKDLGLDSSKDWFENSTSEVDGTDTENWTQLDQSGVDSIDIEHRFIDFISGTFYKSAGDTEIMVRPYFEGGVDAQRTGRGFLFNDMTNATFWFNLCDQFRATAEQKLSIQARAGTDDSNNVKGRYITYGRLAEKRKPQPDEYDRVSIIADVESGLYVKRWDAGSATNVFQKRLVDILRIEKATRNGLDMTRLTSTPSWGSEDEDTFYWDAENRLIEIKMPSGKNPEDDDQTIVIIATDTYGRTHETLYVTTDSVGTKEYYSYDPVISSVPSISQELQVRSTGTQVATSIGAMKLSSADNSIGEEVLRRIYEGYKVHVKRGFSSESSDLRDFETITVGTMGVPRIGDKEVDMRVFDTGINLQNSLSERDLSVYQGNNLVEGQILPIVYGPVLRVPAYRVTNNEDAVNDPPINTTNDYKICGHALSQITAVYADASSTDALSTSGGGTYPESALVRIDVDDEEQNGGSNPDGTYRADVIYCDVVGLQHVIDNFGQANSGIVDVEWPGEMMSHLLQSYPKEISDTSTGIHQFTNTTTHTPNLASGNAITGVGTSDVARLAMGDILKFESGGNSYHAVITEILSTTSFHVHLQEFTGDNSSVSYNTSSTVTLVEKSKGVPYEMIDHDSFWRLDHRPYSLRGRLENGKIIHPPPVIGHLFEGSVTVAEALDTISRHSFTYWYVNRMGRVSAGFPDFEAGQLIMNPGFETNDTHPADWQVINLLDTRRQDGNMTITTTKKFEGLNALQVDNSFGSFSKNPASALITKVTLPRSGKYCFTCMLAQESGDFRSARVSILNPADNFRPFVSEEVEISSNYWTRASVMLETDEGICGTAYVMIHPTYPSIGDTPPAFDNAAMVDWFTAEHPGSGWQPPEDSEEVTTWYNKGTSGNNMIQQDTEAPVFIKNSYNGIPSLRIDSKSTDSALAYSTTVNDPLTLFVVASTREHSAGNFADYWRGISAGTSLILGPRNNSFNMYAGSEVNGEAITDNTGVPKIFTITADETNAEFYINGTSQGSNAWSDSFTSVKIAGGTGCHADFYEIIMYDDFLSDTDRNRVESYLMAKYGIGEATLLVDNAELYPVAASLNGAKTVLGDIEFRDEIFSEASVTFNLGADGSELTKKVIVTDSETQGLSTAISQGRSAIRSTTRLVQDDVRAENSASATGVAASEVNYYGRHRYVVGAETVIDGKELPRLGDKIYTGDFDRVLKDATGYPLLTMSKYEYNAQNAKVIEVEGEGRMDPQYDREELTGAEIPVGAIVMTTSASTPTDYEEVPELSGWFIVGADFSDGTTINNFFGNIYHRHDMAHTHAIGGHTHDATALSIQKIHTSYWALPSQNFIGPLQPQAEGVGDGTEHTHSIGSPSAQTSSTTSGESSAASVTLTSGIGDTVPSHIRVRFLRRKQNTVSIIPDYLMIGYEKNSTPSNWSRETSLDGYYIRGWTDKAAFSGISLNASFAPAEAGSTLTLASGGSSISIGSTLTITESSNTCHVIAIWPDYANNAWYVYPLHSEGDVANGTVFTTSAVCALGNNSSGVAETVGATYTALNHDHGDIVGSHTHTAEHTHTVNLNHVTGVPAATEDVTPDAEVIPTAGSAHTHTLGNVTIPSDSSTSGSASGSTVSSVANNPAAYNMVFMSSDGTVSEVPAGGLIFWAGTEPPPGYTRFEAADGLLIRGADTSQDASADSSQHTHTFAAAAHTFSHNHGGSFMDETGPSNAAGNTSYWHGTAGIPVYVADRGHTHDMTVSPVTTTDPTLTARTVNTGSSDSETSKPFHRKIMICRRG